MNAGDITNQAQGRAAEPRAVRAADAQHPIFIEQAKPRAPGKPLLMKRVGAVLRRRIRFASRFIYWTWRHGTPKHAAWVCHHEGFYW